MKRPESLMICGKKFVVKYNPKKCSASYDAGNFIIEIGTKEPESVLENFIHEITELIFNMYFCRYTSSADNDSGCLIFVANHKEFQSITCELQAVLRQLGLE